MEQKYIMTAFGKDRPGIVAEISEMIFENHCNLEDSNMGRLADEFTLILLLAGQGPELQEKLTRDCRRLERERGLSVFIRPLEYNHQPNGNGSNLKTISVEGVDQGGIVYKVSQLLGRMEINVETLNSKKKYSPGSGTALYAMEIKASVPGNVSAEALAGQLDELGEELNVDITLS
ncbi:MAG: ACT domain-containing protein [Desulfobacter sp.]